MRRLYETFYYQSKRDLHTPHPNLLFGFDTHSCVMGFEDRTNRLQKPVGVAQLFLTDLNSTISSTYLILTSFGLS